MKAVLKHRADGVRAPIFAGVGGADEKLDQVIKGPTVCDIPEDLTTQVIV